MGVFGLVVLMTFILMAIAAPQIAPFDPSESVQVTIEDIYAVPSSEHLLGTDDAGKDVLSSFIYGSRVSLVVGFFASLIAMLIGGSVGIIAGYYGGRVDNILMRFTDILLVIPDLPLIVVIVALTKPSVWNIILVIGLLGWTTTARLMRSQTLAVKSRKFVLRARALGAGKLHIIRNHILPLVMPLLVVNSILVISLAIINESVLSFLGLGDPTSLSWGQMLNFAFGRGAMSAGAWWVLVTPGVGIVLVVLSLALIGQALEQVLNPRIENHHLSRQKSVSTKTTLAENVDVHADQPILRVDSLSVNYLVPGQDSARAVDNISFELVKGETLGIVGESGCGKTTLMMTLLRLLPAAGKTTNGSVIFRGNDLVELSEAELNRIRWKDIAIVFQGAMNALNPVRTVGEQIAEPIRLHLGVTDSDALEQRVSELLEMVGIREDRAGQFPHQLSGGMRQRAVIAMALACDPKILIVDEPTTALDVMIQAQILELLSTLKRQMGLSIILVSHDLAVVAETCDTVLVMYSGAAAEYAPVATIFNHAQHPYTQELLKSIPDLGNPDARLVGIRGYPPRLNDLPPGCRFAPRCPAVFDRCRIDQPDLHRVGEAAHFASCHLIDVENMEPRTI
jgi:peptide/nickel transport system permease protein